MEIPIATPVFEGSDGGGGVREEQLLDLGLMLVALCCPENHVVLCCCIFRGFLDFQMVRTVAKAPWSEGSVRPGWRRQWVGSPAALPPHRAQRTRTLCWEVGTSVSCFYSRLAQATLKGSFSSLCYKIIKSNPEWVSFVSPGYV